MKQSLKTTLKLSEVREKINALQDVAEPTAEQSAELAALKAQHKTLEAELRSAIEAEDEEAPANGDGESVELRQLVEKAALSDIVAATVEGRATAGATAELQQHLGMNSNAIPLELLRVDDEQRAAATIPSDLGRNQAAIVQPLFAAGVASYIGVATPSVPVGERTYPVLTTKPTVGAPAKGAAQAETTGAFVSTTITPSRLQAAFSWQIEDAAVFAGMERALRMALNSGLSEQLDQRILTGTDGLLTGTTLANNAASAVSTWANYRSQLGYARIDGLWAQGIGSIKMLVNPEVYEHMSKVFRSDNIDSPSALDDLSARTGGVRVSALMPKAASNKANVLVRRGMLPAAYAPIWQGVRLIRDEITSADKGTVKLHAVMLYGFKLVRSDAFYKQEIQLA